MNKYKIKIGFNRMDVQCVHHFISSESYWAQGVPIEIVEKSLKNSFCVGVFDIDDNQIAFARVISDRATFGYLSDVFVLKQHRGEGVSKALIEYITNLTWIKKLRRLMLFTEDAHTLYSRYGFREIAYPDNFMEISHPNLYRKTT